MRPSARALFCSALFCIALLAACDPGEPAPPVGTARLALTAEMVAAADGMTLIAWQGAEQTVVWRFPDPQDPAAGEPDEALFDLEPGLYDRLELTGEVAGRPLYLGASAEFRVEAGEEVVVRLVVDPFGRLVVAPLGLGALDALDGASVRLIPRDPLPGDPAEYALALGEQGFTGDVPVGLYDVEIELPALFEGFETLDLLEARVIAGGVITLRPAFGLPESPEPPPPPPIVAEVLELVLEGGQHILGAAFDVSVRALDGDGRDVADYAGEVEFSARIVRVAGIALGDVEVILPAVHRFDPEADRGGHLFADGLAVNALVMLLGLASVEVEVTVSDDGGLEASAQVCVRGLLGGC